MHPKLKKLFDNLDEKSKKAKLNKDGTERWSLKKFNEDLIIKDDKEEFINSGLDILKK